MFQSGKAQSASNNLFVHNIASLIGEDQRHYVGSKLLSLLHAGKVMNPKCKWV